MKYLLIFVLSFLGCAVSEEPNLDEGLSKLRNVLENVSLPPGIPAISPSAIPSIEEGELIIKQKCDKNGGNESFDNFMIAREQLSACVAKLVDFEQLKTEIKNAEPTGDLDIVFSKYCRKSPTLKECVTNFTDVIDPCLEPKEKQTKIVFQNVSESLLDFICYKEGDRIALFIAEGGPECITDKKEAIQHCLNVTLSKYIPKDQINASNIPVLKLEKEECTSLRDMHLCVVNELEKCKETTPSNIVDALMKFMMKQTPCNAFGLYPADIESSAKSIHVIEVTFVSAISLFSTYLWR